MKSIILLILNLSLSFQALAKDYALQILEQTKAVLQEREGALSLEQVKQMAAGDNIDVKIAYERLYQAQTKISLARAQYFPYGLGDVALIHFSNSFTSLLLVELATSIPSKWYNTKKEKHLASMEYWNLKALRENIKNQTAQLYYAMVKEHSMIQLASYELKLLEELIAARTAEAQVGVYDVNELEGLRSRLLNLRNEYLKFEAYFAEEKAAMKMLLNLPYDAELRLQPVSQFLTSSDFDVETQNLAMMATERSYEIRAAEQFIQAAFDAKRSAQWSILSFSGIGFGYLSNVRLQSSKITEAQLMLEATENTVYNNVFSRSNMFRDSIQYFLNEKNISDTTENYMQGQLEVFNNGESSVAELIEAELYYLRDYRDMLRAHYNAYTRLDDFERVVQGKVDGLIYADAKFSLKAHEDERRTHFSLVDKDNLINDIESVTYIFEDQGINDIKSFRSRRDFSVRVSSRRLQYPVDVEMRIVFTNGEVVSKKVKVTKENN